MIKKIKGIVIKEIAYKETSKIIEVFTEDEGIISIMAKGAKRIKSPLFSGSSYLSYGEFCIYQKNNISTLKSVDVINSFKNIMKDVVKISASSYIVSLVTQVYKQNAKTGIYDLLLSGLIKINDGINTLGIVNIIETKLLVYLGLNLHLDNCAICGGNDIVNISLDYSGYLCSNCTKNHLNPKALKLIKIYKTIDINKIDKLDVGDNLLFPINKFLDEYYYKYTGLYLKSKNFFIDVYN